MPILAQTLTPTLALTIAVSGNPGAPLICSSTRSFTATFTQPIPGSLTLPLKPARTQALVEDEVDQLQRDGQLLRVYGAVQQQQLRELGQAAAMALHALQQ